jgi:hypothetical protein
MNTASPFDNQEKSVTDFTAARTADFTMCGDEARLTPAKQTRLGFPGTGGLPSGRGFEKETPCLYPDNAKAAASCADTLKNVLRFILLFPFPRTTLSSETVQRKSKMSPGKQSDN